MGSCRCSCFLVLGWDHVDVVVFLWPAMGSVPDNYKCPLCGRVGNGGYALDGVGFPICTEGYYSCLWFQWHIHGLWPEQIIGNAIRKIFWFKTELPASTWELIAAFAHTRERAALSRPSARTNIPTTPPSPTEAVALHHSTSQHAQDKTEEVTQCETVGNFAITVLEDRP